MLELSAEDREYCQDVTTQLLDRTLFECEELDLDTAGSNCHARLDNKRWKKLQSHLSVTLYADRRPNAAWLPVMHREDWDHPISVVSIGEMNCSVDDVLLALVTPDVATQRMRSVLRGRRPEVNCRHESIVRPSQTAPFQNMAVSRSVNSQHWPFTMFVGPREMVLACATGEITSSNGNRCGYEMVQSVALRDTYAQSSSLPRTQMIQARVFWEKSDRSVIMYNKFVYDAKTRLPDAVKQGAVCRAAMDFWKFIPRAIDLKKLRWCMKNRKSLAPDLQRSTLLLGCAGCGVITQKSQSANTGEPEQRTPGKQCELCNMWLCGASYCRSACQLKMVCSSETKMYEQTLMVCPRCISFVRGQSAENVARSELSELQSSRHCGAITLANWEQDLLSSSPEPCVLTDDK
ncbi:uncharacterized protein PITG_06234 [Phytophthora infestans T30-4]|uniref:Uncharacterized protein n=1 Tax=Phytophthora infestans (strain T30-4) TaxID=403677 RepID=D0N4D9_PHYIT|nr:uncharacterized protein PITG_06234 [Phytophthora infestans T30-4]EEY69747.1 conserved hypothetical protein [Phytophthora infestans T30-4]|eukprot:XP_002998394.1 conserved hypothetical protein [Phytophthora infestans T30-4]